VISLGLALGLAELLVRLAVTGPTAEAPDVLLRLPLQHGDLDREVERASIDPADPRVRLRTDGRGYIEPSRPNAAPAFTLAFLGGSTTECRAVREELRYPARVAALLTERGFPTNALNAGRSAATVHDALHVLLDRVAFDRPDFALLMEAVNDRGVLARDGSYAGRAGAPPGGADLARWSLQLAARRLALAEWLRTRLLPRLRPEEPGQSGPHLGQPAPLEPYRERVEAFVALARAFGIEPVLVTQPLGYLDPSTPSWVDAADQERFDDALRAVGERLGATVIDLAREVAARPESARPGALFYDGLHVNDAGSQLYAAIVAEALAPRLAARAAPPQ
jgi:lysophospholipase L1-like esterase